MLVDGKWTAEWHPVQAKDEKGGFVRQTSSFRNWVTPDGRAGPTGEGGFAAEAGRYHLYVALICPWASRTLDRPQAEEARRRDLGVGRRAGADRPGLALRRLPGVRPRRPQWRHLPSRALHARGPLLHRAGDGPGSVGQASGNHRQQRVRRYPADAELRLRSAGRRDGRPLSGQPARRDRRAERAHLPAPQQRGLPDRLRDDPGGLRGGLRRRLRHARRTRAATSRMGETSCSATG